MVLLRKVLVGPTRSPVLRLPPLSSRKTPLEVASSSSSSSYRSVPWPQHSLLHGSSPWYAKTGAKGASLRVSLLGANRARSLGLVGGIQADNRPLPLGLMKAAPYSAIHVKQPQGSHLRYYSKVSE